MSFFLSAVPAIPFVCLSQKAILPASRLALCAELAVGHSDQLRPSGGRVPPPTQPLASHWPFPRVPVCDRSLAQLEQKVSEMWAKATAEEKKACLRPRCPALPAHPIVSPVARLGLSWPWEV